MKLSVHGSRGLTDERVKILILEEMKKYGADHIVTHGEPAGACGVARDLCKEKAIPLTLHFLNFAKMRGAFEWRSKAVLQGSERALLIWDGKSKGTNNELKLCRKLKVPYTIHTLEPAEHEVSNGFPIDKEWGDLAGLNEDAL